MNTTELTQPTLTKLNADDRGRTEIGWLKSRHSFSFGEYYDPARMGFHTLRVLNDDVVAPGMGFGTHPHRDAEILSYVISGQLQHKDSMGNGRVIKAGDFQYMSAGSGVSHSEFNPSRTEPVHFLQVWLKPNIRGGDPLYAERTVGADAKPNALTLLFSGSGRDGSALVRQDAEISIGRLYAGSKVTVQEAEGRGVYVHLINGQITVLDETLAAGDAAEIENAGSFEISASADAEFLYFSLA